LYVLNYDGHIMTQGRGRPAKPGWEKFTVKLPTEVVRRLDARAKSEDRSRSDLLADGAELYLRKKPGRPAKKK
jgi:metal-responsive CopG/Arc/MetJ family transcriptional regulator